MRIKEEEEEEGEGEEGGGSGNEEDYTKNCPPKTKDTAHIHPPDKTLHTCVCVCEQDNGHTCQGFSLSATLTTPRRSGCFSVIQLANKALLCSSLETFIFKISYKQQHLDFILSC